MEADVIHTIDSIRLADALERAAAQRIEVLVEANLGGEAAKAGVGEADLLPLLESLRSRSHLAVVGLMCIPPVEGRRAGAASPSFADGGIELQKPLESRSRTSPWG